MSIMEIALLIIGVIIFVMSFLLPDGSDKKTEKEIAREKEEVHRLVEQEIDSMKLKVNEATNDTVEYAVDKAERSLEKVSNEKIMAVNEYAGTILEEINKNHKEVMFLYDMLRDKQEDLTNAVRKADATVKEIANVSHSAQAASETLLRGMSVATVSQKGLTKEQKAVFDDIIIPDASPVVFKEKEQVVRSNNNAPIPVANVKTENITSESVVANTVQASKASKPRGIALAQSKIFADLNSAGDVTQPQVQEVVQDSIKEQENIMPAKGEKVVYDMLSGSAFRNGNIVGVDLPARGAVTVADYEAMRGTVNIPVNVPMSASLGTMQQAVTASGAPVTEAPANNNDRIIELSKQGLDTVDIAKALNLGVGEVKLVLDLFR